MTQSLRKAMILAAGLGTRMRHLTDDKPKAMVEVDGRPLIDHAIERLVAVGVDTIVVNLHYKADVLEAYLRARQDVEIVFSDERDAILDTGGGIVRALPHFGDDPFWTHNCDTIWHEDATNNLQRMVDHWAPDRMDGLMLLAERDTSLGYDGAGDFFCDAQGQLSRRGEQPTAPYVWAGAQIIKPSAFTGAPQGPFSTNRVWDALLATNALYGVEMDGTWMHVGSPEGVDDANALIRARR